MTLHIHQGFFATCDRCGWFGNPFWNEIEARNEGDDHRCESVVFAPTSPSSGSES